VAPRFAFVADDFTGATDTLATLALAGLRTSLYLDAARMAADRESDAVGLATATRSMAPEAIAATLAPAASALGTLGAPVSHYKVCSTFDSSPAVGSIGAAVAALREGVPGSFLPIVGGQPNLRRYCAFGTLFAAAGADGPVHRIDRHPTMSRHPVTPMHEADLRVHLAAQGLSGISSIDCTAYGQALPRREGPVLFDVTSTDHLAAVGEHLLERAHEGRLLAVGASSVAQAMIAAWRRAGTLAPADSLPRAAPAGAPVFVLSGSRSPVTARQVEAARSYEIVELRGEHESDAHRCIELLRRGRHVLAHTGLPRGDDPSGIARAGARLMRSVLDEVALARAGVSGGDTSSLAVHALGIERLELAAVLDNGVALCRVRGRRLEGLELMLKGGQMGAGDIFERLLQP
jgi:uncharacterized protein YgbK (DUF1537 family)